VYLDFSSSSLQIDFESDTKAGFEEITQVAVGIGLAVRLALFPGNSIDLWFSGKQIEEMATKTSNSEFSVA